MKIEDLIGRFPNYIFGFEFIKDKSYYAEVLKTQYSEVLNEVDLDPIIIDKSGSIVCLWRNEDNEKLVWIDSEGTPCNVFAEKIEDFLEILPYGPNFIWDYLSKYTNHLISPNLIPDPSTIFTLDYMTETYINNIENQDIFNDYCNWLNENDLKFNRNPIKKIKNVISGSNFLK